MQIRAFFDHTTATVTYVVSDPDTKKCAIIDSVRDYDPQSGKTSTTSADQVIEYIQGHHLEVEWILETHVHADHLTAANYLKKKLGGKIAISANIRNVLQYWVPLFNTAHDTPTDGSQFDVLFENEETFNIGTLKAKVIYTPGHTPACLSYFIEDAVFVGDAIFMPNVGTARTDFPGADAKILYHSIQKILSLPDETRIFVGHDYPAQGHQPTWETTVKVEKEKNIMLSGSIGETEFVQQRNKKDEGKPVPRLLLPALQVNLRAGEFGSPEKNGIVYIKIPIDQL